MTKNISAQKCYLKKTDINCLEDIISVMGINPVDGGNLFRDLCCSLLKEMGFKNIHIRKGNETGRDIDAQLNETKWFFECKRYAKYIDTPQTAYKFLQLDILSEKLKPDYFVLMSNASIKSILHDVIEFKKTDVNTYYSVETWTNEPYNQKFNKILLSYPDAFINFINTHFLTKGNWIQKMIGDFKSRSKQYLLKHSKFFDTYCFGIAILKKSKIKNVEFSSHEFVLYDIYKFLCSSNFEVPPGLNLILIGSPIPPVANYYDFNNQKIVESLVNILKYWEVYPLYHCIKFMGFGEADGTRTYFFDSGSIVLLDDVIGFYNDEKCFIFPEDWLGKLRTNCIRMRNFSKRGMLPTPTLFRAYIMFTWRIWEPYYFKKEISPIIFKGLEYFFPPIEYKKYYKEFDMIIPSGEIKSDDLIIKKPFDFPYQIGWSLAETLWKNSGMKKSFLSYAKQVENQLFQQYKSEKNKEDKTKISLSLWKWHNSFDWLFNQEFIDLSYERYAKLIP